MYTLCNVLCNVLCNMKCKKKFICILFIFNHLQIIFNYFINSMQYLFGYYKSICTFVNS